ncbi:MAG: hypothetical protein ACKVUS_06425 [Saprospiraceae bacterium]
MQMVKATRLDQVYSAFSTRPLAIEELDEYYLNTALARGDNNPRWSIANRLKNTDTGHLQFLFIGYRGCGKSTELNTLQRDVQTAFWCSTIPSKKNSTPFTSITSNSLSSRWNGFSGPPAKTN